MKLRGEPDLSTTRKRQSTDKSIEEWRRSFAKHLSAACEEESAGQAYGVIGRTIKEGLADYRGVVFAKYHRGDHIASALTKMVDLILCTLFERVKDFDDMTICAVGGYGRKELAPFSDIDILFLHSTEATSEAKSLLDLILYPLWDSGLKIGHSVHTPASAIAFAKEDMVGRTAFLDARFLCGDERLFEKFSTSYDKLRRRTKKQFIRAKLAEQDLRQANALETRYLTEPDVKEGKGGLRDLQTIWWVYKYVYGDQIEGNQQITDLMDEGDRRDLRKAELFLWSVRAHLHELRGRPDDTLKFDIQPDVAERLGYSDRSDMTATERLMKHYFLTAVDIGRLTRVLCTRLEEENAKSGPMLPRRTPPILLADEARGKPNIKFRNGRLDFANADKARERPVDLFRLFRAISKDPKFDIHPDALTVVRQALPEITSEVRRDPVIAKVFLAMLAQSKTPVRVLRIMEESGLLGKYVPAFGRIVGRIKYGLYRQFTLDEHVFRALMHVHAIRKGREIEAHPRCTEILQKTKERELYYFAVFLHQSIWSLKKRTPEGVERLVGRIAKRFGFDAEQCRRIGWACAQHLTMVRTAERRNLADPRSITKFAKFAGTKERLDLLLVLSVCYLRIVGHHSWDNFARRQLSDLYHGAEAYILGGEEALEQRGIERTMNVRRRIEHKLAAWPSNEREGFLSRLTDRMFQSIEPDLIARFATLVRAAEKDDVSAAVNVSPGATDVEAIVYADDRPGLLCDLAAAIASVGASVRSVQALTLGDEKAVDVFTLNFAADEIDNDPAKIAAVHKALLEAAKAKPNRPPKASEPFGDRRSIFNVESVVRIDQHASEDCIVVEAEGLDRPGLLHDLAFELTELRCAIFSAHIATYGERAVDTFYLTEEDGGPIEGKARLKKIESALLDSLTAGVSA